MCRRSARAPGRCPLALAVMIRACARRWREPVMHAGPTLGEWRVVFDCYGSRGLIGFYLERFGGPLLLARVG